MPGRQRARAMNQKLHRSPGTLLLPLLLLLFVVIIFTHTAGVASRLLPPQTPGLDGYLNANKRMLGHDVGEIKEEGSWNVMELEDLCEDADEECLKRRMTYEAHLDYIYTQRHKP